MRIIAAIAFGAVAGALIVMALADGQASDPWQTELAAWLFAGAAIFELSAGFFAYFAPLWIALVRGHPDTGAIAGLDLLLGWTVIGWLLAMIWALSRLPARHMAVPDPTSFH